MRPRSIYRLFAVLILITIIAACGSNSSQPTLQSIAISPEPASVTIPLGAQTQFTATGNYSNGSHQDITTKVTWASSDATVISIDTKGLATALKRGSANISASSGSVKSPDSSPTGVSDAVTASVAVSPNPATVVVGGFVQFTARATLTDGTVQDISSTATWNSSNTTAASIDAAGIATGLAVGTTNITASTSGMNGTVTSPVSVLTVTATLVSIDAEPATVSVPLGNAQAFTAVGHFSDNSAQDLTTAVQWASSRPSIATIDANGMATTMAEGSTNVTASYGTVVSNTAALTVTAPVVKAVAVTPANPSIGVGGHQAFTATGTLTDNSTKDITSTAQWASSDPTIATITNPGGVATGVAAGSTKITATDPDTNVSGSTKLTVGTTGKNGMLQGNYTFNLQKSGGMSGREGFVAGTFTADGAGNITNGILDINPGSGGTFVSGATFTGTYGINDDYRGSIHIMTSSSYEFWGYLAVVSSSEAYLMQTGGNGPHFGKIVLNSAGPFSNSSVKGPYVVAMGAEGAGFVGQLTADGSGHFNNGLVDVNVQGQTYSTTMSGSYSITDSARGRGTATISTANPQMTFNFEMYVGGGSLFMVSTDPEQAFRAEATPQAAGPFSNGSLSGDYALIGGSSLDMAGGDNFGGQFNANGSGAWANGVIDLFRSGKSVVFGVPLSATYNVADTSRGRFTAVETPQGGSTDNVVFYTLSGNRSILVDLDSPSGAIGEFRKSTGGPYTKASLNGNYSFVLQGCPLSATYCTGDYTQTGVFTADGNGNITITVDTNNDGSVHTYSLVPGSYVVGDSGSNGGLIAAKNISTSIRFYFIDATHLYLEDGDANPTRRVLGEATKQN
jgi:uncharacterized protein YjdB